MLNIILAILIVFLAFPVGYLLAKVTREEIKGGRKAFLLLYLINIPLIIIIAFLKIDSQIKLSVILTLFFIMIVSFMSFFLSYKKDF